MKKLVLLMALSGFFSFTSHAKHEIRLNLEEGKTYYQNYSMDNKMNYSIQGQSIDMDMNMKFRMSYTVKNKTKDHYDIIAKYTDLSMVVSTPYGKMDYNSQKVDSSKAVAQMLRSMTADSFGLKMNMDGSIKEVTGLDSMLKHSMAKLSDLSAMEKVQVEAQLQKAYGKEGFIKNMEGLTSYFPDHKVAINDTWQKNNQLSAAGMGLAMNTTYTLKDYTKAYAIIAGQSILQTPKQDSATVINGLPATFDITGTSTSSYNIDANSGWIISATTKQTMSGTMSIKGNAQMPNGMTMPMKISTDMTIDNK